MTNPLPPDQIERYEHLGTLFPIPVLTDSEVRFYRSALEEFETMSGGTLKRFDSVHLFFQWAYRLATHARRGGRRRVDPWRRHPHRWNSRFLQISP